MGIFNTSTAGTVFRTRNLAGGVAYKVDPRYELAAILLTSFLKNQAYRSSDDTMSRIMELVNKVPFKFAAKTAIYARNEHGMRSVSHVVAAEVAKHVKGESWTKDFFKKVFFRPDDMLETLALYQSKYGRRPIPNSLKKGMAASLETFDAYRLAKYRGEGKSVKLVDLVNIVHPNGGRAKGSDALKKLVAGDLSVEGSTWEAQLSEAGKAETEEEVSNLKAVAWSNLLEDGKLGYLAALRNLRNITEQAPNCIPAVCDLLTNREAVRKSKVFPFQFLTAMDNCGGDRRILNAIVAAIDLSLDNVPRFDGSTLIVLDESGSMGYLGDRKSPFSIGSLFAAALYRSSSDADLMLFADNARYATIPSMLPTWAIVEGIEAIRISGGTSFHAIFQCAKKHYDRIIILSDMQGWIGGDTSVVRSYDLYARKFGESKIYSFDLLGYGTLAFPQPNVFCVAGVSDKIFDVMALLDQDRDALINTIDAIQI